MSEVAYSPSPTQAGETNPAALPTLDQVGVDTRSGRVVRAVRNVDTGDTDGATNRFAKTSRDRQAGGTSSGNPGSNLEEVPVRDTPLGDRQARVVQSEGEGPPATGTSMGQTPRGKNPASDAGDVHEQPTATHHWPRNFDPGKLTPEALARQANNSPSATGARQTPVHALKRVQVLQNLTEEVRQEFLRERGAAWSVAEDLELDLDDVAREAIKQHVLHDDIPADLVPAFATAYLRIKDELGLLRSARPHNELQTAMRAIRDAMNRAFDDAAPGLDHGSRHRACKMFWRFVLAPGSAEQALGIVGQLQRENSPLRALGEGATWYRNKYHNRQTAPQSSRAEAQSPRARQRSARKGHGAPQKPPEPSRAAQQPSKSARSGSVSTSPAKGAAVETAADYSLLMRSLAEVLHEKTGSDLHGLGIEGNGNVSDETIATLRNLGAPMPAPRRLRKRNRDAPISESGLAAIRQQLSEHLRIKGQGKFSDGVSVECIRDVKNNTYVIEDKVVPGNQRSVGQAMLDFCKARGGDPNQHMLKNLSMLAYRGAFDCVRKTCLNHARPEIALFSEEPVLTAVDQSHRLYRDRFGDVTLESRLVGKVQRVKTRNESGSLETVKLKPDQSHLDLTVSFKLDGTTGLPELKDVSIDYAFIPAVEASRDSGPAGKIDSDLEHPSDDDSLGALESD